MRKRDIFFLCLLVIPMSLLNAQSSEIELLAHVNQYPGPGYSAIWGYTAPDGREYALLGVQTGTSVVDITDAPNVDEVGFIPGPNSLWRELKSYREYAYVVNETGGGMQIIDLSDLPNSVSLAATYTTLSTSHTIYIDTTNAICYLEGTFGSQSVRVLSLANPLAPVQISNFGIECHDMYAQDNIVYVSEGSSGSIGMYDLTIPTSPVFVTRHEIPAAGYVHNAWLTEDGNFMMTTEETSNKTVKLWDISDLGDITLMDTYLSTDGNLAHNVHIKGNFAYLSHYDAGVRIVDITNPSNIFEVGYYNTFGGSGLGCWGVYPFFESGKVIASDVETGLWVLQFDGGASGIACDDIFFFNAKCNTNGAAQAMVKMSGDFSGETVTFDLDGEDFVASVMSNGTNSIAKMTVPHAGMGEHTVTLEDPAGCYSPVTFTCQVDAPPDPVWDAMWAELDGAGVSSSTALPQETKLIGNYPNPLNPSTTFSYALAAPEHVSLRIYNMLGELVRTIVDEYQAGGYHESVWDGRNENHSSVGTGVYICRLTAGSVSSVSKVLVVK